MGPALITFPLRAGVAATKLALRPVAFLGSVTIELLDHVLGDGERTWTAPVTEETIFSGPGPDPAERPEPEPDPRPAPDPEPEVVTAEPVPDTEVEVAESMSEVELVSAEPEPEPTLPPEPTHVSEEPELVAESADAEAADGPSPELTVEEPWEGYRRAHASQVIESLSDSTREELAVILLYETANRGRKSVLRAVERELKVKSAPR